MKAHPYRRPVSASEQLYLAGLHALPPVNLNLVLEGTGVPHPESLRAAVREASAVDPGSRLVLADRGRTWVAADRPPPVEVRQGPIDLDAEWLQHPFDVRTGPTCALTRLDDALWFRAFHGVMDARGLLAFVSNVFRALRGDPLVPHPSVITDAELAARAGPRKPRAALPLDAPCPIVPAHADPLRIAWQRRTLRGLGRLGVATIAAALAQLAKQDGLGPLRVMVPVDLRGRTEEQSTGNLSLPVFLEVAPGSRADALAAQLMARLERSEECWRDPGEAWLHRLPHAAVAAAVRWVCRRGARSGAFPASALVSALGRVERSAFEAPGFHLSSLWSLPVPAGLVPLGFSVSEHPDHVELTACGPADPEARRRLSELLEHVEVVARSITPSRPADVNHTTRPLPGGGIYGAFTAVLHAGVAQECAGHVLTYPELDHRARRIAGALRSAGLRAGDLVIVRLPRGPHLLPAWLGVWAAGGTVVSIDPTYPAERIAWMIEDSGARFDVADFLDGAEPVDEAVSEGEAIAYVMYTSGSTGRPKGVAVPHSAVVNYCAWAAEVYGIDRHTRFACFTSPAFDLTITSTVAALCAGARVVVIPGDFDPLQPQRVLESGATAVKLTPAHLSLFAGLEALSTSALSLLVVGGAQLGTELAERCQRALPEARIFNEYGPTECTVGCTVHRYRMPEVHASVPIGRPGFNQRVYVLDEVQNPVPASEAGELWVAGAGLARGYLQAADQTQDRFRALPSVGESRAYRTGDRVQWGPGGVLLFVGRVDRQLEIRGHRVEPSEIEAAMHTVPGVSEAVVVQLDGLLAAYVVGAADLDAVRMRLQQTLPAAWQPTFIERIDHVPLTAHGKLQVEALPRPSAHAEPAPQDQGELAVQGIWATVLHREPHDISLSTPLYALGGDSLMLVEIFRRVHADLVPHVSQEDLLSALQPALLTPTVRSMALALRELR